jgi:hypothetical protein
MYSGRRTMIDRNDNAVTIAIEGIDDPGITADLHKKIRQVCREARSSEAVTVALAPADVRGRWDLGVKSAAGRHVTSFSATLNRVPEVLTDHLRRILSRLA